MAGSVLLIVVDNPAHRALFNRYLGGTVHHLVFATDGEDGFDRFGEVKPDLVIAHVEASRLDGTILCQLIRKQPRGERVPFVLLSEEFTDSEVGRQRAATVGADGFLPFPFDRTKLNEQITPLLAFGRPEPTGRGPEPIPAELPRRLDTSPVTIERLRSAQVSPEIANEQRTEASPLRPPRIPDLATDTRDDLPVRTPSGRVRDPDSTGDLEPVEAPRPHESARIEIEEPIEDAPADPDGRGNWSDATEGLLAEPEAPSGVEPRPHVADSADTVVSFLNPFLQEGRPQAAPIERVPTSVDDAPSLETLEAERAPRVPMTATMPAARGDSARNARGDDDSFVQKAPPRVSSSRTDGRLEARPELRAAEPRAPEVRAPELRAPELRGPELRPEHRPEPSMSGPVFEEPPILDRPARDPIEEPPISGVAPPLPDHSEGSKQARMLQEPVRELTPSASEHLKREAMMPAGRRGLDESQLGKRLAKRVRTMFRLLDEVDYYQILGVDPDADAEHLKRAYFDLSLEFHPDRFFLLRSGDLKEKIYAIYRRISEAYAVLSDDRRRAAYDSGRVARHDKRAAPELREELRAPATPEPKGGVLDVATTSPKAKRFVELARGAMDEGDVNGARLHLAFALAYEESPALRAASDRIAQLARPALR